jgi:3-hydroxyacyl-CoA dehydrogenase/enoyl-CoA hydratase/3-hydroxybutyryl-CoA epimerase
MSAAITKANKSAPKAEAKIITLTPRADGIAVLSIDDPSEPLNTITQRFGEELIALIDRVESDASIKAAVLISAKKDSFIVGANIDMLRAIKLASDAERMSAELAKGLVRLGRLTKPFVAAVHGSALGGGFELALACHAIVATDDKKTALGLPEVQLGLIPAANGLLRVAERAGLQVALDLGLTGKNVRPAKAKKLGLVDEVCPAPVLLDVACATARDLVAHGKTKAEPRLITHLRSKDLGAAALEDNPFGRAILFKKAREETRAKTKGHYPATERVIDVLERFGSKGFAAAAALEAKSFGELVVSETAHRLIEVFFATTALKKDIGVDDPKVKPHDVDRVAMLGGGLMGGGIAYITIDAGIPVRLKDKDDAGLGRGLKYVRGILDERVKKKQLPPEERDQKLALLTATTDFTGLKHADVVIEAVFEDLSLKHAVLKEVESIAGDQTIFASNTSSIPISKIASVSRHPETVVGMHYFSPVHKMPLLEVIRTEKTAPWVVATAVALGKKQGKTVIVVKDGVGFYTSRVLGPYMNEAAYLLSEGIAIEAIDRALVDWGWPVGPIQLLDEVGIDVAAHVGEIVHEAFGDRMIPPPGLKKLVLDDRKGRKNERGFYRYDQGAMKDGKRQIDASVYGVLGIEPKTKLPAEEIQMRCSLQLINEALLCYGEGILRSARDGDVGAIFGLGFPPFRGGPFRYVDTLGAAEILRRVRGYEMRFGKRWAPAPILIDMARKGERFYKD